MRDGKEKEEELSATMETLKEVVKLWRGFLERKWEGSPGELFEREGHLNACTREFCSYCAKERWVLPRVAVIKLSLSRPDTTGGRPASWLFDFHGEPRIAIDLDMLQEREDVADAQKVAIRCVLHEAGHLALHWGNLHRAYRGPSISPAHEAEAWWFSSLVCGLALGWQAQKMRDETGADTAYVNA